jgi:hypothetical protein
MLAPFLGVAPAANFVGSALPSPLGCARALSSITLRSRQLLKFLLRRVHLGREPTGRAWRAVEDGSPYTIGPNRVARTKASGLTGAASGSEDPRGSKELCR